jgi:hypothetical protein
MIPNLAETANNALIRWREFRQALTLKRDEAGLKEYEPYGNSSYYHHDSQSVLDGKEPKREAVRPIVYSSALKIMETVANAIQEMAKILPEIGDVALNRKFSQWAAAHSSLAKTANSLLAIRLSKSRTMASNYV